MKTRIIAGRILKSGDESPHGLTDEEKSIRKLSWETPKPVFNHLNVKFNFKLDAAASKDNALVSSNFITEEENALTINWAERSRRQGFGRRPKPGAIWCNPPFVGQGLTAWVEKMAEAYTNGSEVVAILPASIETKYWQKVFATASAWIAYEGRMIFTYKGVPAGTPMGAVAIIIWSPRVGYMIDYLAKLGTVITHWELKK